jgi:hypothetical protein
VAFEACPETDPALVVKSLALGDEPLRAGANNTITVRGSLSRQVKAGVFSLNLALRDVNVFAFSFDLCEGGRCELPAGPVELSRTFVVPAVLPEGEYELILSAVDEDAADVLCVSTRQVITPSGVSHAALIADGADVALFKCELCSVAFHAYFDAGKFLACDAGDIISDFCEEAEELCEIALEAACEVAKHNHCDYGCLARRLCKDIHACSTGGGACCR